MTVADVDEVVAFIFKVGDFKTASAEERADKAYQIALVYARLMWREPSEPSVKALAAKVRQKVMWAGTST